MFSFITSPTHCISQSLTTCWFRVNILIQVQVWGEYVPKIQFKQLLMIWNFRVEVLSNGLVRNCHFSITRPCNFPRWMVSYVFIRFIFSPLFLPLVLTLKNRSVFLPRDSIFDHKASFHGRRTSQHYLQNVFAINFNCFWFSHDWTLSACYIINVFVLLFVSGQILLKFGGQSRIYWWSRGVISHDSCGSGAFGLDGFTNLLFFYLLVLLLARYSNAPLESLEGFL